jgi:WD40 repeat protein
MMTQFYNAFISYGRADSQEFATKLYHCLTDAGFHIWFDQNDIPLAVDFQHQIDDGIAKADNFLFIIAPHSVNSPYCLKEIKLALQYNKRIIPLLHVEQISRSTWQERNPQGTDSQWQEYQAKGLHSSFPNMHPEISKINWVYFREDADNFDKSLSGLIEIFRHHADYVRQHTEILEKALEWEQNKKPNRYLLVGEERQTAEQWLDVRFKEEQAPCQPSDLHCEFICESIKNANNLLTQVFIRYAESDRDVMQRLTRTLQREKITIWTDRSEIKKRMTFQEKLHRGIAVADNFVYLVSPYSITSDYCQKEIDLALAYHKRVICFIVPSPKMDALPDFTYEIQANELIKQIKDDKQYYHQHKILLVQALKWQEQNRNPSILFRGYNLQHFQAWLKVASTRKDHPPTDLQKEFIEASEKHQAKSLEVFISYSRTDSDLARKINDALQFQGKTTWFDQESIAAGTDFKQEIYRGIENSDNFLFIISPHSVNSPYCGDEVEYAQQLNKRVVTILYRQLDTATLHPALAKVQWIDFNQHDGDFYANFSELVRTLDTDRDHVQSHTKWSQRALEWQEKGKNPDFLLRGSELSIAQSWLTESKQKHKQPPATALQIEFIAKSRQQKWNHRLWQIGSVAGVFLLVSGAGVFAGFQWQIAERQATIMRLREAGWQVKNLLPVEPMNGLLWAIQIAGESEEKLGTVLPLVQSSLSSAVAVAREQNRFTGHENWVRSVAFFPDGQKIVSSSSDRTIRIWDIYGHELAVLKGHTSAVTSVAVSPDGQTIVSGSDDQTIRIWKMSGRDEKFRAATKAVLTGHEDVVTSVAVSPDGKTIVSGSLDRTIRIWEISGRDEKFSVSTTAVLTGHEDVVTTVAVSPDGKTIASGSRDDTVRLWDVSGGKLGILKGHENDVTTVAVSGDGQTIVSGSGDGTIRIWDRSGNEMAVLKLEEVAVLSVAITPDNQNILAANSDKSIRIWDMSGHEIAVLKGHKDSVWSVASSPDGRTIASAGRDRTVRLWSRSGNQLASTEHDRPVRSVAFSPDGQRIISGSEDQTIRLWNLSSRDEKFAVSLKEVLTGHEGSIRSVAVSPDGQTIVSGSEDNTVRLWNRQGQEKAVFRGHEAPVYAVAFSPDGQRIVSASEDKTLRLWNRQGEAKAVFSGHEDYVRSVAFSPDGQRIVSGSYDQTVRVWDIQGNQLKVFTGHEAPVYAVAFSPNGRTIVSGGEDDTLRLWNFQGQEKAVFQGHDDAAIAIAFSPDGQRIVSGSYDHTVRLWDLSGNQLAVFSDHQSPVYAVAFSPDGDKIISGSSDGTIRVWGGSWQSWLEVGCDRLQLHPVFVEAELNNDEIALGAVKTCEELGGWTNRQKAEFRQLVKKDN